MFKNILWFALIGILVTTFAAQPSLARPAKESRAFAQKVKQAVNELGIGEDVRVKIKLDDGFQIKGYISEISEDGFTVIGFDSRNSTRVSFFQVKQIKRNNLSGFGIAGIVAGSVILGLFIINVIGG